MRSTGTIYENAAETLLINAGLHIIDRNFAGKSGEIDIIAADGDTLVFVEVRSRTNPRYLSAAGSVNKRKQQRLIRTAQWFLMTRKEYANASCRFDVIAYEPPQSTGEPQVRWIKSAFTA